MGDFKSSEDKKILDMLKEQAENAPVGEEITPQATKGANSSADDIKNMLRQEFLAEKVEPASVSDDYSFDTEDFVMTGEIELDEGAEQSKELPSIEEIEAEAEEIQSQEIEETKEIEAEQPTKQKIEEERFDIKEIFEAPAEYTQISFEVENLPREEISSVDEVVQEILDEADDVAEETANEIKEQESAEATMPFEPIASISEETNIFCAIDSKETVEEELSATDEIPL